MATELSVPGGFEGPYRELRQGAGACWLRRDFIRVRGADSLEFLQGQLTQDVSSLDIGGSVESLLLSPEGRLDAYLRVTRLSEDELVLDVAAGWGDSVLERLERFRLRTRVDMDILDWKCLSIKGPGASRLGILTGEIAGAEGVLEAPRALRSYDDGVFVNAQWPGLPGLDILGPAPLVPAGVCLISNESPSQIKPAPAWEAAWNAVRIEAGMPTMGVELTTASIPAETGLVDRTVSFTKGCYTGQELVARMHARGSSAPRRLCGLVFRDQEAPPGGSEVRFENTPCGMVTTSSFSLELGVPVALAFLARKISVPNDVSVVYQGRVFAADARLLPLIG